MINNSKDDLAKLLVRNLIAALLKREPKDRPSLDSILRRGYIQKVSTWLSDGPPRSVLPNSSKSARRRCSPNRAGALTSVEARGKVKQDGTRGQEPRDKGTFKVDKKGGGDQRTFSVRKGQLHSPEKVPRRQKSGKERGEVGLYVEQQNAPKQGVFKQNQLSKAEPPKIRDKQKRRNLRERSLNHGGEVDEVQELSGIRGGQLMRTRENLKIENHESEINQGYQRVRGGQLMRTQEYVEAQEQSQQQPEQDIFEDGLNPNNRSPESQFHRPWERNCYEEKAQGLTRDQLESQRSYWSPQNVNLPLHQEWRGTPARVTSSLGFSRCSANEMTEEELRQVLERPRSNPTLQATPQYQSFSALYHPYGQSQSQTGFGSYWDQQYQRGLKRTPQVTAEDQHDFYERQWAAQRFKERQMEDMFESHEHKVAASVVQSPDYREDGLDEQQYLEELKKIRLDNLEAKRKLAIRSKSDAEELDDWVDMSHTNSKGKLRGRDQFAKGKRTVVLRRDGVMDGEQTYTVPPLAAAENTYLIQKQKKDIWWGEKGMESFSDSWQQNQICAESFDDDGADEEAWWGEDEEEYERHSCAEDLSSEEDGEIESLKGQEPGPSIEIRRRKDLRLESPGSCPEASSRDGGMEKEEEGEEDGSVEILNISTETSEVGEAKESQRIERGLRAGRRFTGIPIHDRYLRGYYTKKETMPDLVQGAEDNVSPDFPEEVDQDQEEETESGWEAAGAGLDLARLATIREEEERWGFTQTRDMRQELSSMHQSLGPDDLLRSFSHINLGSSKSMRLPSFHYEKGNDTIEFEKLEQSFLCQGSLRKGNENLQEGFSADVDDPFKASSQLLRTTEKPLVVDTISEEAAGKQFEEDAEGVWHLDESGAKVPSEEVDLAAWLEEERRRLEQLLGEEKLMKLYQVVAMIEEEEEENLQTAWEEVAKVMGAGKDDLVDRVVQLVIADTKFMNGE